ncbi:MAG: transketolase [Saprospiraceae bacterium]|nr:transketolase [Saprospiraceae bacterium]
MQSTKLINQSIDTIRTLSMDGVQKANSGHPGAPMALAPAAYVLFRRIMKHHPGQPQWMDRDRFILSNGHASMLQYSTLYLTGYGLSLDDLKSFRQWESKTPGHPEYDITPGVETTTGPLGQGFMTGIGMAMAEAHLGAKYNRPGFEIIDHHTYAICSDGDLMEGASHEAASLAGHLGLGKLIYLYDDNHITIEGKTDLAFSEDVEKRFEAYGWQVINLGECANDVVKITDAFEEAKAEKEKPSLIILRTHIGFGSPNYQDTAEAHGSPLGEEEVILTKKSYGWPSETPFYVPDGVLDHMNCREEGEERFQKWNKVYQNYRNEFPELAVELERSLNQSLTDNWKDHLPTFSPEDGNMATRAVNSKVLNAISDVIPWLIGGSADLEPSTKTAMKGKGHFSKENYSGRNIAWGIREMAMCAASSGMALHKGLRPYAATFFVFTDYARAAIRLSAIMELPVIYVMTHDSIGLGEDGPTHQPIEHLASLRAMPNLTLIRPADANETVVAWKVALERKKNPVMLVLSRQGLPILDRSVYAPASGVEKGAYILSKEQGEKPAAIIIATGSEVQLALEAQKILSDSDIDTRVVSMPSWELFENQDETYQDNVLPPAITNRVSIEAGAKMGWHKWVGNKGKVIGIDHFGASAPYKKIYEEFGITAKAIVENVRAMIE